MSRPYLPWRAGPFRCNVRESPVQLCLLQTGGQVVRCARIVLERPLQ